MTAVPMQCRAVWNDFRCQLAVDHDSAHCAADAAGLLLSWANAAARRPRATCTAWVPGVDVPPGTDAAAG